MSSSSSSDDDDATAAALAACVVEGKDVQAGAAAAAATAASRAAAAAKGKPRGPAANTAKTVGEAGAGEDAPLSPAFRDKLYAVLARKLEATMDAGEEEGLAAAKPEKKRKKEREQE